MATSRRIVLVDPLGEILFSGESLSAKASEAAADKQELCPETKRSAESGTYRAVDARLSVSEAPITSADFERDVDSAESESAETGAGPDGEEDAHEEEVATRKRGFRAA